MLLKVSTASEISWKTTRVLNWRVRIKCWIRSCIKCWILSRIGSLIIEDSCLEDDIIIVEDVDAEWARCEEWESLDQSLCLEKNPGSLQKISNFFSGSHQTDFFLDGTCSSQDPFVSFQHTTKNTLITLKNINDWNILISNIWAKIGNNCRIKRMCPWMKA